MGIGNGNQERFPPQVFQVFLYLHLTKVKFFFIKYLEFAIVVVFLNWFTKPIETQLLLFGCTLTFSLGIMSVGFEFLSRAFP